MNRILKISMLPSMLMIIIAATVFLKVGIGGARAASSQTCGTWSTESSPNPSATVNRFSGVAANSANDVWAVGAYQSNYKHDYITLIEHWNGSSWSISSSPNIGEESWLQGVVASSATNAWSVGYYLDSSGAYQALIEQWNGTSWNIVANPAPSGSKLLGVTAFSASNVWAVGYYTSGSGFDQTLVEHWDGTSWSVVPSPNPSADFDYLSSVARVKGTNQVWAVGTDLSSSGSFQTLIERWNGTSWKVIASPNPGFMDTVLYGVSASSASDIWTVGYDNNTRNGPEQTLIEQWNGTSWSVVSSPNVPGSSSDDLSAVTSLSANNIWAVGSDLNSSGILQTLTEQWNGTSWSVVSSANDGANNNVLSGVSSISRTGGVWAVGNYTTSHSHYHSLTEFYC